VRILAFLAGFLLLLLFAYPLPWERILKGQNDFLQFYAGANLIGTGNLHSFPHMRELQQNAADIWMPSVRYIRPDFYALLLKPLSWLPFPAAYGFFQALNLSALLTFLWLFRERQALRWLVPISIPLLLCIANGQDVEILLLLLASTYLLEKKERPIAAGLCLALCSIKAHFMIFTPLALLFWRRWRMFGAAAAGVAFLSVAVMPYEGWDWFLHYPRHISADNIHEADTPINARGLAMVLGWTEGLTMGGLTAGVGLMVVLALWMSRKQGFETGFCLAILGGLLTSYHMGIHDNALLLLLVAIAPRGSPMEMGAKILLAPIVYFVLLMNGFLAGVPSLILVSILGFHLYSLRYSKGGSQFPDSERSLPVGSVSR
jgi:hypothetical protein